MRTTAALVVTMALVGCGGRTHDEPIVDTSVDASSDADAILDDAHLDAPADSAADLAPDAPRSLLDVPLEVGEMAFNEINNTGFTNDVSVRWSSTSMLVTATGHVSATIETTYGGPPVAFAQRRDVLFWHVDARFLMPPMGDWSQTSQGETVGVMATTSSDASATFSIDGSFTPPGMTYEDGVLDGVEIELTWVRVYRAADGSITFHVLPGRVTGTDPAATIAWNTPSPAISGDIGYYVPIAASAVGGGAFDYPSWIAAHVTW